jgi:hypothetical protein
MVACVPAVPLLSVNRLPEAPAAVKDATVVVVLAGKVIVVAPVAL